MRPSPSRSAMYILAATFVLGSLLPVAPAAAGDPTVRIETPFADDVVAGWVNLSGSSTGAGYVNVSIDGGGWNRASGTGAWSYLWNSSAYSDGTHSILAVAVNGSLSSGTASVQVAVNNTPPAFLEVTLDLSSREVITGEPFTASGFARFDTGVRPAGVPVQLTVENASSVASTDRRGFYSATLAAPDKSGEAKVRSFVSASGLTGTASDRIDVRPASPPDLSVSSVDIFFSPEQPFSDEEVTVGAIVKNAGQGNATAKVNFTTPAAQPATVEVRVPAGGSWNPSVKWKLPSGNHTITVTIVDIQPFDANSSNNEASTSIRVLGRPDLVMVGLVFSNSRPAAGLNITLQARLNNTGDRDASGTVRFYDGNPAPGTLVGSTQLTVPANSSRSAYLEWRAAGEGEHVMYAVITDVTPTEGSASNNQIFRPLTVRTKKAAPEPQGAIAGFEAALLLLAVAAVLCTGVRAGSIS